MYNTHGMATDEKNGTLISHVLKKQINQFVDNLQEYNERFPIERRRDVKDYTFLKDFFPKFIEDQNKRALEVSSQRYKKAVQLSLKQFPSPLYWSLCIDGRVLTILMHGLAAPDFSLRVPAGALRDFVRNSHGQLILMDNSSFANLLDRAFEKSDEIVEIFDSHLNCIARKEEEISKGEELLSDDWLVSDVLYKKEMAGAIGTYVAQRYGKNKKVIAVQTSFDPHTGYMYMGLETPQALKSVAKNGILPNPMNGDKGYSDEVLDSLAADGIIFSTKLFASDTAVSKLFAKNVFELDWKNEYVQSTEKFWKAVESMRERLLPEIIKKLSKIYPNYSAKSSDLKTRAMLLLSNAFSGYLHTHHVKKVPLRHDADDQYPYGIHEEEGIKVSEGGYPPYEISMFSVYSGYAKNLPARIELASTLVRSNRRRDIYSIPDRSRVYRVRDDFVKAPVPIVVQEIINEDVDEETWDKLNQIDWADLSPIWNIESDVEFLKYLERKGVKNAVLLLAINSLRNTMAVLYSPERRTSNFIVEQHIVALPVLSDKFRKTRVIIPFFKLGFV